MASEGILFYAADNAAVPRQFMVLTMFEGKLSFSIMTSTRAITGLNINTEYRYDDGLWHEVRTEFIICHKRSECTIPSTILECEIQ